MKVYDVIKITEDNTPILVYSEHKYDHCGKDEPCECDQFSQDEACEDCELWEEDIFTTTEFEGLSDDVPIKLADERVLEIGIFEEIRKKKVIKTGLKIRIRPANR